jgi:antitoxin YefM
MKILSLSEAKMKLSALIDQIEGTDEEVVITRNGKPAVIMLSFDEYESWKETYEIMSNPEFMAEIREGIADLKAGRGKLYTFEEFDKFIFSK